MNDRGIERRALLGKGVGIVAALAVGGGLGYRSTQALIRGNPQHAVPNRSRDGVELLCVLIGSTTCGASEYPGFGSSLTTITSSLRRQAERTSRRFVSIGVAIDSLPQRGLSFLEEFGPFDEISSGGGWANSMVIALIQRDFPGQVAIPQLVLLERVIELDDLQSSSVTDRLLARKVGAERIVSFARILREETMGQ